MLLIWLAGVFVRVYRQGDLLGFYYDQGRDALAIKQILQGKNFPAIGPTTGLEGIFLGPFWFYFLAPFYFIGHGNPAVAAVLVGVVDSLTIFLLYGLGKKFVNEKVGLIAAFLWAFSYWLVRSARWFSNPSPLPFFTVLLLWGLGKWLIEKKGRGMLVVAFSLAISLQLEAASAVFYFPAIFLLLIYAKISFRNVWKGKYFWWSSALFLASLVPQFAFELKNHFLISRHLINFFLGRLNSNDGASWVFPGFLLVKQRLFWYQHVFFVQFDPNLRWPWVAILIFWIFFLLAVLKSKNFFVKLLFLFWLTPLFFLFFFTGNYGHLYDYYLTGFLPVFIILLAYVLSRLPYLAFTVLLVYFIWQNGALLRNYLVAGVDGPTHITLGNQKKAIAWICRDAVKKPFNVDVYVPPVIPYAWDYLWQWYGTGLGCYPLKRMVSRLYTVWEIDPPHPERLESWLERQRGIGRIEMQVRFGGIGVERRLRANLDEK